MFRCVLHHPQGELRITCSKISDFYKVVTFGCVSKRNIFLTLVLQCYLKLLKQYLSLDVT